MSHPSPSIPFIPSILPPPTLSLSRPLARLFLQSCHSTQHTQHTPYITSLSENPKHTRIQCVPVLPAQASNRPQGPVVQRWLRVAPPLTQDSASLLATPPRF